MGKFNYWLAVTLVVSVLLSCKGRSTESDENLLLSDSLNRILLSLDVREFIYPLPSPSEIIKMLNDIGTAYKAEILNPADNVEKYFTSQNKATGLGIYGADLTYISAFEQKQDIQTYLDAIRKLTEQLGITAVDYEMLLSDEYREKLNDQDSLVVIITDIFYNTYDFLQEKSNPDLSVSMIAGMWVELMYLATHVSEDSYDFTGMVEIIVNQKNSYQKVMDLLGSRRTNNYIRNLETKLQVLQPLFDKAAEGLSPEDYKTLLLTIQNVRSSVV